MTRFSDQYAEWSVTKERADPEMERALSDAYRHAWQHGDVHDRYAVLDFVFDRRDVMGMDLVLDGLKSSDVVIARHSAGIVLALSQDGYQIGVEFQDLSSLGDRVPGGDVFAEAIFQALQRRGS
jgi:hypothetical protein